MSATTRTPQEILRGVTASIPDVGMVVLGLSKGGSYAAARRGDIPTISIGGKKRALCEPIRKMLRLEASWEPHET